MKIKRVEKKPEQVEFKAVPPGSVVYFLTDPGDLWIKTTRRDSDNCVRMHDGYLGTSGLAAWCQIVEGAFVEEAK